MSGTLVLVRHGQSEWNLKNLFTGWRDPDLTEKGVAEAHKAGEQLKAAGITFDVAYTSVLKRAQRTLGIILGELGQTGLVTHEDKALNERDYGDLSGLNKDDARKRWGEEQVAALAVPAAGYTPAPCTPHTLLEPESDLKLPQTLQLATYDTNGCKTPEWVTPGSYTHTWGCQSDTSFECPNFLASANVPPNGNWAPTLLLNEDDAFSIWVTICLVDYPWVCSSDDRVYEGAHVS